MVQSWFAHVYIVDDLFKSNTYLQTATLRDTHVFISRT